MSNLRRKLALDYLEERTGTLEYRFIRYSAVANELFARGMSDDSILVDLGAGGCDFDFYLRTVRGWKGRYLPVDASIDGTDLEDGWCPGATFDYAVAIELLEHVARPDILIMDAMGYSPVLVATTPNTNELGETCVRAMDHTHVRPIYKAELEEWGADVVKVCSFFGKPLDSLLAVWDYRT